jgi:hypothetical protein
MNAIPEPKRNESSDLFPASRWTLVRKVQSEADSAFEALGDLRQLYWPSAPRSAGAAGPRKFPRTSPKTTSKASSTGITSNRPRPKKENSAPSSSPT